MRTVVKTGSRSLVSQELYTAGHIRGEQTQLHAAHHHLLKLPLSYKGHTLAQCRQE
jgi:hypothetical protein